MNQSPTLSKSRYMAGQQCHKRLYLECFHRDLAGPVDSQTQARFDEGQRVGELARALRPGGVLIVEDHLHPREAIDATARALANPDIPAIYEAAFQYEDVLIRVDILARTSPQSFEFIEVKSSTKVKPEHKPDVGIQLWVLEGAGLAIDRAILAHLNNAYEYAGGEYEIDELFTLVDLTADSRASHDKHLAALQATDSTANSFCVLVRRNTLRVSWLRQYLCDLQISTFCQRTLAERFTKLNSIIVFCYRYAAC